MMSSLFGRRKFDIDEFYDKFQYYKKKLDKLLMSRNGTFIRFGSIVITIFAYPITNAIFNGPLLNMTFPWRYSVNKDLSDYLRKVIEQQTFVWLEKEGGSQENIHFTFSCQENARRSLDSIRFGSMSTLTGAQIALPFYARFQTISEAIEYAKKNLQPFNLMGKVTQVDWDSENGRKLLSTFILSNEAIAFLIARDLYSVQSTYNVWRESLTWFCYVFTYMICFFFLHVFIFQGDSVVFFVALPILMAMSIFCATSWNKLGIYVNEHHANVQAANLSTKHTKGGKEFYTKFLQRNRLLREMVDGGNKLFTKLGDIKGANTQYVGQYCGVCETNSEFEELTPTNEGDDLPE